MYPVSDAYLSAISSGVRRLQNSVTVGGVTYQGAAVRRVQLHEGVSDNSDRLLPGVAACASVEITLVAELTTALVGQQLTAKSGLVLPDGSVEDVPLGVFVVQNVHHTPGTNISTLTCYDLMCKLDEEDMHDILPGSYESAENYRSLMNKIVPNDNSGSILWASGTGMPSYITLHRVNRPTSELRAYQCKELVGYIAGAHGKFARMTRSGGLEFSWYRDTGYVIPSGAIYMDGVTLGSSSDVTDSLSVYSNDDVETVGYAGYTNDLITSDHAAAVTGDLFPVATTSSPGTCKFRGNPALQPGDIVGVTLADGSVRKFAISEQTLTFQGGLVAEIECHGVETKVLHDMTATQRDIARLKKVYRISDTEEAEA